MSKTKLSFMVFAFLIFSSFALASIDIVKPDQSTYSDSVYYEVSLNMIAENVTDFQIVLYDSSSNIVNAIIDLDGRNFSSGVFSALENGIHSIYVSIEYDEGGLKKSDSKEFSFTVDNPFRMLGFSNPTPNNATIINSININDSYIVADVNKNPDYLSIIIYNASDGQQLVSQTYSGTRAIYDLNDILSNFGQGEYIFKAAAELNSEYVESESRTITIKTEVPSVTEYILLGLPESVNEDTTFSFTLINVTVSELPLNLMVVATSSAGFANLGNHVLTNITSDELVYSGSVANPGFYNIRLTVYDNYGNSMSYIIGNLTVNDVIEPTVNERRRGSGSGSDRDNQDEANNTSRYNFTTVYLNETEEDQDIFPPEEEEDKEESGFFSFITGAVTGAFSSPPRAILTFIIIVVIIYAVVKIMTYVRSDEEKSKKVKKNGKKAEKEETVSE